MSPSAPNKLELLGKSRDGQFARAREIDRPRHRDRRRWKMCDSLRPRPDAGSTVLYYLWQRRRGRRFTAEDRRQEGGELAVPPHGWWFETGRNFRATRSAGKIDCPRAKPGRTEIGDTIADTLRRLNMAASPRQSASSRGEG